MLNYELLCAAGFLHPGLVGCFSDYNLFFCHYLLPLVKNRFLKNISYFLTGAGILISVYFLFFLGFPLGYIFYVIAILFFGTGLLAFFPFYLLYHSYCYYKDSSGFQKKLLLAGFSTPLIIFGVYFIAFSSKFQDLERILGNRNTYLPELASRLPKSYITEQSLGAGFKYHTSLEFIYDGWRPPLHDPFFNLFVLIKTGSNYPLTCLSLQNRIAYYSYLFPDKPIKISCPCSYSKDGKTYLTDFSRLTNHLGSVCK